MRLKVSSVKNLFGGYAQVLGFAALTAAGIAAHAGSILNYAFPVLAMIVAVFLFLTSRSVYVAFVWWIWIFSPLVRRLVDFQSGFHLISPVLLAPLLVTLVAFGPLLNTPRAILKKSLMPFLLVAITYVYALAVGILSNGAAAAVLDFANYGIPFGFGLYLLNDRKNFLKNRDSFVFAVTLGLLIISLYGLYQFYRMPPWDAYWLAQSKFSSAGLGLAEQVRLFGTLNSPGPYATVLMVSLIFALVGKGRLRIPAAGFGLPAFGLTEVRTDWGGLAVAVIFIAIFVGGRTRVRLVTLGFVVALVAYPLVTVGPVADQVQQRLATFGNIKQDNSFQARED